MVSLPHRGAVISPSLSQFGWHGPLKRAMQETGVPIIFTWDGRKEAANRRKQGVAFDEALTVFGDPLSITVADPMHSDREIRFIIVGRSRAQRLLVVVHTDHDDYIRIISARPASPRERKDYEGA